MVIEKDGCDAATVRRMLPEGDAHLQDPLVVDLVEDGAVDLVGLQRHPVEDGHPELCLDWLLDFNGCVGRKDSVHGLVMGFKETHNNKHMQASRWTEVKEHTDDHSVLLLVDHFKYNILLTLGLFPSMASFSTAAQNASACN